MTPLSYNRIHAIPLNASLYLRTTIFVNSIRHVARSSSPFDGPQFAVSVHVLPNTRRTTVNSSWIHSHTEGNGDTHRSLKLLVLSHANMFSTNSRCKSQCQCKRLAIHTDKFTALACRSETSAASPDLLRIHSKLFAQIYCLITLLLAVVNSISVPKTHDKKAQNHGKPTRIADMDIRIIPPCFEGHDLASHSVINSKE